VQRGAYHGCCRFDNGLGLVGGDGGGGGRAAAAGTVSRDGGGCSGMLTMAAINLTTDWGWLEGGGDGQQRRF
jgi:hypothetical protein